MRVTDKPNTPAAGAAFFARTCASIYPRSTLASAFTESSFTCYKLLSRIQEPFLFVKRHAVIQIHEAARRSELAYRSRHARQLIVARFNSSSDVSCPISAGRLVS